MTLILNLSYIDNVDNINIEDNLSGFAGGRTSQQVIIKLAKFNAILCFMLENFEYNVTLLPQDYNLTTNYSIRNTLTTDTEPLTLGTSFIGAVFTASNFQPYITQIKLYQDGDYDTPVIVANLPKPIRKSDKINTRFKIKLDI